MGDLRAVFIALFLRLGGDPDRVLAACRVGDRPMKVVSPLNVHLGVMVGFAQKYVRDAGIGAIVALMPPCTVALSVVRMLFVVVRHVAGPPLGPA